MRAAPMILLSVVLLAAGAAAGSPRVLSEDFIGHGAIFFGSPSFIGCDDPLNIGAVCFRLRGDESFVEATIVDATGIPQRIGGVIVFDQHIRLFDVDQTFIGVFCESTPGPLDVPPGAREMMVVIDLPATCGINAPVTGTVIVRLT